MGSPSDVRDAAQQLETLLEQGLLSVAHMSSKNSDVNVDGNINIGVSVDGGGQVVIIVISALAALIVILLIIYFSCKRGCVCCDNLCCNGRCHKSEREQKAVEENNKQLQQQLQIMNTQMRTMQAVQMQQYMGSNQALAMTNQPMPNNFHKNPPPSNPNQLSIGYQSQAQVSHHTPTPSPHVNRRDNRQRDKREWSRAPSSERHDKSASSQGRYPDR